MGYIEECRRERRRDILISSVVIVAFVTFIAAFVYFFNQASEECARSTCPNGATPRMTQHDGCLCVYVPTRNE